MKTRKNLKPLGSVIQVCPECRKVGVYLNDKHECSAEGERNRQENLEYYD